MSKLKRLVNHTNKNRGGQAKNGVKLATF